MSDVLARICDDKRRHVAARKRAVSQAALAERAQAVEPPRGFAQALSAVADTGRPALIAELKKASPSKGLIRADFDPPALAAAYASGGAACLSVLTDKPYFQGEDRFLTEAHAAVSLPVLRKDFMLDPYQVVEARALGADCILLIMAALEDGQAAELAAATHELGMDTLVEVHDEPELERALRLEASLLGINNRNLKTLEVDLATTERLVPLAAGGPPIVCESGLHGPDDIARLTALGVRRFLVGESLMRQADVAGATAALLAPVSGAASGARAAEGWAMARLTHLDEDGKARMVDVTEKEVTERRATARARVLMKPETVRLIAEGGVAKGDVLGVARLAGIMAAKRTADLIPLCHPLALSAVDVTLACDESEGAVDIEASCRITARTGVEMEALTAASVAALTVYDMCKAADRGMRIADVRLTHKAGGRSGEFKAP